MKLRCASPLTVVRLKVVGVSVVLVKGKAASPPTARLTMTIVSSLVLAKVQVTFSPGSTATLAGLLPSEQVALSSRQPAGTLSLRL